MHHKYDGHKPIFIFLAPLSLLTAVVIYTCMTPFPTFPARVLVFTLDVTTVLNVTYQGHLLPLL